ncbi:MAG: hypothetical protein HKN43_04200 [Rhodothermales bacterium]|nr:hypothetical protein [Rhodothermales bacterium]
MKRFFTPTLAAFLMVFTVGVASVNAQDDQEYKEAYNAGIAAAEAKNYAAAYEEYGKAADLATQAGDEEIAEKSRKIMAKIDKLLGTRAYKAGNYELALKHFDTGLTLDPSYAPNLHNKGLALKQLGRIDESMASLKLAADSNDSKTSRAADKAIRGYYHSEASKLVAKDNASSTDAQRAISLLTQMQEYVDADADTYFYSSLAHNVVRDYPAAIASADQALAIHRGSKADKAKIHFVKGEALLNSGDSSGAKASFSEATYGSYKALAEHYLETL